MSIKSFLFILLFNLFITFLSLLFQGYMDYYNNDHTISVPTAKALLNPDLYERDEVMKATKNSFFALYFIIIEYIGGKISTGNIGYLYLVVYALTRFLFFLSIFFLSKEISGSSWIPFLSAFIFILPKSMLAESSTQYSEVISYSFAQPLLIISLAFLLKRKVIIWAVITAFVFYFHAMSAVWTVVIGIFFLWAIEEIKNKKKLITASVLALVILLPFLIKCFSAVRIDNSAYSDIVHKVSLWRSSHHLYISAWDYKMTVYRIATFVLCSIIIWRASLREKKIRRLSISLLAGSLSLWMLGVVFTEIYPVKIMYVLQFLRSSIFEYVILLCLFSCVLGSLFKNLVSRGEILASIIVAFVAVIFAQRGPGPVQFYALGCLALFVFRDKENSIGLFIVNRIPSAVKIVLVGICLFTSCAVTYRSGVVHRIYSALFHRNIFHIVTVENELLDVARWAKNNTAPSAYFAVHPNITGFRVWSERSQLSCWKDGAHAILDGNYAKRFFEVMNAYGLKPSVGEPNLDNIGCEKVIEVGLKYGCDYGVCFSEGVNQEEINQYPVIYKNEKYSVIRITKG